MKSLKRTFKFQLLVSSFVIHIDLDGVRQDRIRASLYQYLLDFKYNLPFKPFWAFTDDGQVSALLLHERILSSGLKAALINVF